MFNGFWSLSCACVREYFTVCVYCHCFVSGSDHSSKEEEGPCPSSPCGPSDLSGPWQEGEEEEGPPGWPRGRGDAGHGVKPEEGSWFKAAGSSAVCGGRTWRFVFYILSRGPVWLNWWEYKDGKLLVEYNIHIYNISVGYIWCLMMNMHINVWLNAYASYSLIKQGWIRFWLLK